MDIKELFMPFDGDRRTIRKMNGQVRVFYYSGSQIFGSLNIKNVYDLEIV